MKSEDELRKILENGSLLSDQEQLRAIIALAAPRTNTPAFDEADKPGEELVALRKLSEQIGKLDPSSVTIKPALFHSLMLEMETRSSNFARAFAQTVLGQQPDIETFA